MPLDKKDANPSETTKLLGGSTSANATSEPFLRSYSGGNLPLASSYEDLRESVELRIQAMNATAYKKNPQSSKQGLVNRNHAIAILLFGCTLCVALVSVVYFHFPSRKGTQVGPSTNSFMPFSLTDPVEDLGLFAFDRPDASKPPDFLLEMAEKRQISGRRPALPTNAWYQNMLLLKDEPSNLHRVYTVPYLLDTVGLIPGLRMHRTHVDASAKVMQLAFNEGFGLTIGASVDPRADSEPMTHRYKVTETTELGFTMEWNAFQMKSSVVKGMPYATMEYSKIPQEETNIFPTIASTIGLRKDPVVDGAKKLDCSENGKIMLAENELELVFGASDFTWLVFFSEPVWLRCTSKNNGAGPVYVQVVDYEAKKCDAPLVIRSALLDSCTEGSNPVGCREGMGHRLPGESQKKPFGKLLRHFADYFPGQKTSVTHIVDKFYKEAQLTFDWDVQRMPNKCRTSKSSLEEPQEETKPELLMFALPHHLDRLDSSYLPQSSLYCRSSITGPTCLVQGTTWTIAENLPQVGFRAPRPPRPEYVPALARALQEDINYTLPDFFMRGAGDTYFSGKMLAKLGRILVIAEELVTLCDGHSSGNLRNPYAIYCDNSTLPSLEQFSTALNRLRSGTEIWINGTAETPFVYDTAWGGVVSCGCHFSGDGCENKAPDCPAFTDQGLNFGNGFYNDMHFHYGYMIFAAAVVSHFDHSWARQHNEQVMMLVRNIANPSPDDVAFPLFRHKDWYQGSSWASGVPLPPYLNGKNQESSSEAIAAYESVAIYGQVMHEIWESDGNNANTRVAADVKKAGLLMAATELRSAKKYWQVTRKSSTQQIYPDAYEGKVIGILWSTMAQFGTWFGEAQYLPYGIQLLPLTPISEERDGLEWMNEIYHPLSKGCSDSFQCTESGWVVLKLAVLATIGYAEEAARRVKELPEESFTNAGGNGHSVTNTLWYISTRPKVEKPIAMDEVDVRVHDKDLPAPLFILKDCHIPSTCTDKALDQKAGEFTCRERIEWLIKDEMISQWEACSRVAGLEYPTICGPCDPTVATNNLDELESTTEPNGTTNTEDVADQMQCPPCTQEQCNSDLNRCPVYEKTFVCTEGPSAGGCGGQPWDLDNGQCSSCCEMTGCEKLRDRESLKVTKDGNALIRNECPPCEKSVCYSTMNRCPVNVAPYLCTAGASLGGCASSPWAVAEHSPCSECCEIKMSC